MFTSSQIRCVGSWPGVKTSTVKFKTRTNRALKEVKVKLSSSLNESKTKARSRPSNPFQGQGIILTSKDQCPNSKTNPSQKAKPLQTGPQDPDRPQN